jgi:hypothetical protein
MIEDARRRLEKKEYGDDPEKPVKVSWEKSMRSGNHPAIKKRALKP